MTATDHAAFLRCICERPAEDGPRLVYADWLEEQGDGDRAEFIRVQVELAGSFACDYFPDSELLSCRKRGNSDKPTGPRTDLTCDSCNRVESLRARSTALLTQHAREWARPVTEWLPKCSDCDGAGQLHQPYPGGWGVCETCRGSGHDPAFSYEFRRGFIEHVAGPSAVMWGGECERCRGSGDVRGDPTYGIKCGFCSGKGRRPGLLSRLVAVTPIMTCGLVGAEPQAYPTMRAEQYGWYRGVRNESHPEPFNVPTPIWARMVEMKDCQAHGHWADFPTLADANAALSNASIDVARADANLPKLERR
jgi:uncharacterized protein (TIGR02996 family)